MEAERFVVVGAIVVECGGGVEGGRCRSRNWEWESEWRGAETA